MQRDPETAKPADIARVKDILTPGWRDSFHGAWGMTPNDRVSGD